MIEGKFEYAIGAKPAGFSHGDFGLVIQALHNAARDQLLRSLALDLIGVRAQTRRADGLAVVVDPPGESDGVARERAEFPHLAVWSPDRGLKPELLIRNRHGAGGIGSAILRKPDHLT